MAAGPVTAFCLVRSQGWEAGAHGRKSPTNCSSLSVKPGSVPMGPTEEKGGENGLALNLCTHETHNRAGKAKALPMLKHGGSVLR